jgi:hypothetical protein
VFRQGLNARKLARHLEAALEPALRLRARQLGAELHGTDGVPRALEALDALAPASAE